MSAAAPDMKPSKTTARRIRAPPSATPASTPISKPPTFANTSNPSAALGALRCSARRTTSIFCASSSGVRPVPAPVVSCGGAPVMADTMALEGVVLPMPISPVAMRSAPACAASCASATPARTHSSACARDIAGPCAMSAVPLPMRMERSSGCSGRAAAMPASTMIWRAPICRDRTLTAAPPDRKLSAICAVTAWG